MDFSNQSTLAIFIIIILALVAFLAMGITFLVNYLLEKKKNDQFAKRNKSYSVFIIDRRKEIVTSFTMVDLKNKMEMNLSAFYSRFVEKDVEKLKNWIDNISNNDVSPFLEADVFEDGRKTPIRTLLKMVNYNQATGKIIIQSEYVSVSSLPKKFRRRYKSDEIGIVSRVDIANEINSIKTLKGFTFAIRFSYLGTSMLREDTNEQYLYTRMKYIICSFTNEHRSNRKVIEVNNNQFVLFDLLLSSSEEAVQLAISISDAIKKELRKDANENKVKFGIGIVQNSQYYHDFNSLLDKAERVSIHAQQSGEKNIFFYDKNSKIVLQTENYAEHIDMILSGNHLSIKYRPIIDTFNNRTLGFFSYVKGLQVLFNNYYEMMKYSSKYGKNRELFDYIARQIIPNYSVSDRTNGASLFIEMSVFAIDHAIDILGQIETKNKVDIVLLFDEHEICDSSPHSELIVKKLEKLHSNGYGLALSISDKKLLLDSRVNNQFDYFVVTATNIEKKEKYNSITTSLNSIIASLQRYNKPIIATDIPTKNYIDIIIQSGVNLVSSECNGLSSEVVTPISDRRMKELNDVAISASRRV